MNINGLGPALQQQYNEWTNSPLAKWTEARTFQVHVLSPQQMAEHGSNLIFEIFKGNGLNFISLITSASPEAEISVTVILKRGLQPIFPPNLLAVSEIFKKSLIDTVEVNIDCKGNFDSFAKDIILEFFNQRYPYFGIQNKELFQFDLFILNGETFR